MRPAKADPDFSPIIALAASSATGNTSLRAQGDFDRLSGSLRLIDRKGNELLRVVYRTREKSRESLTDAEKTHLDMTMRIIDKAMGKPIRVPGVCRTWLRDARQGEAGTGRWANQYAQRRRNEKIKEMHEQGMSMGQIARSLNIDKSTVSRTIRKVTTR